VLVGDEPELLDVAVAVLLPPEELPGLPDPPVGPATPVSVVVLQAARSNRSDTSRNDIQYRDLNETLCGVYMIPPCCGAIRSSHKLCPTFG